MVKDIVPADYSTKPEQKVIEPHTLEPELRAITPVVQRFRKRNGLVDQSSEVWGINGRLEWVSYDMSDPNFSRWVALTIDPYGQAEEGLDVYGDIQVGIASSDEMRFSKPRSVLGFHVNAEWLSKGLGRRLAPRLKRALRQARMLDERHCIEIRPSTMRRAYS